MICCIQIKFENSPQYILFRLKVAHPTFEETTKIPRNAANSNKNHTPVNNISPQQWLNPVNLHLVDLGLIHYFLQTLSFIVDLGDKLTDLGSFFSCYLFIFFLFFISWRLITLQYCSGFCHTLTNRKRDTDILIWALKR